MSVSMMSMATLDASVTLDTSSIVCMKRDVSVRSLQKFYDRDNVRGKS